MRHSLPLLLALGACQPDLGPDDPIVTGPTILAIAADPAEAAPYGASTFRALVASPTGTLGDAALDWALCTAPKPPAEDNAVSVDCLGEGAAVPLGRAATVTAPIPADACARFGPDTPPQPPGSPPLRPRDPDVTGGYYQPVRARLGALTAFALFRITCNLPGATAEVAAEYRARYPANNNPRLGALEAFAGDQPVDLSRIPRQSALRLRISWSADSSETYPVYDAASGALVDRREALRLSWLASAGRFASGHTGVSGDSAATSSDNGFTPSADGPIHLWLVLRDERGGVDYRGFELQ